MVRLVSEFGGRESCNITSEALSLETYRRCKAEESEAFLDNSLTIKTSDNHLEELLTFMSLVGIWAASTAELLISVVVARLLDKRREDEP